MSETSGRPLIHQIIVEIQYRRGMIYFDRCGSLMSKLEDELKAPFIPSIPVMQKAELNSPSEFLTVSYGPKSFIVSQAHAETVARVEQNAPRAWALVADSLEVGGHVWHQNMRVSTYWPTVSDDDAFQRIQRSGLVASPPLWNTTFGIPATMTVSALSKDQHGNLLRAELLPVNFNIQPQPLREDIIKRYASKSAILLNLDFGIGDEKETFSLTAASLKGFIRKSMDSARELSGVVGPALGFEGLI